MPTALDLATAAIIASLKKQGDLMDDGAGYKSGRAQVDGSFEVEPLARAVLRALRDPDEFMMQAGGGALAEAIGADPDDALDVELEHVLGVPFDHGTQLDSARDKLAGHATKIWQAMIDDALDDGEVDRA